MKEGLGISEKILSKIKTDKRDDQKKISFSQFSVYQQCPHRWYMQYAMGNYLFSASINTVFGTAIHETIQTYLTLLFNDSEQTADEMDCYSFFENKFKEEYLKEVENNEGNHFSNKKEMDEFYQDGVEIIKYIRANRRTMFPHKNFELLGMEIPIRTEIKDDNDTFLFEGFIDMVYRDKFTEEIFIEDFKTSTKGWSTYEKKDEIKQSQLLYYKKFFAKQFGVDISKIILRFRILKRKLWENAQFAQHRVQIHEPAHGTAKMNEAMRRMELFISECFDDAGKPLEKVHKKIASTNNCRFCPFKDRPDLCDKKNI